MAARSEIYLVDCWVRCSVDEKVDLMVARKGNFAVVLWAVVTVVNWGNLRVVSLVDWLALNWEHKQVALRAD